MIGIKKNEVLTERFIVGKSSFRYNNLMKIKHKTEFSDYYEISFHYIKEDADSVQGINLIYILYK